MNQKLRAKLRRFAADSKKYAVFFFILLRQPCRFATNSHHSPNNCRTPKEKLHQRCNIFGWYLYPDCYEPMTCKTFPENNVVGR